MAKPESSGNFRPVQPVQAGRHVDPGHPAKTAKSGALGKLRNAPNGVLDHVSKSNWRDLLSFGGKGSFILFVIVPTMIAAVYYLLIASDQYVSEAKFIIRSSQKPQISGIGALLQTTGLGPAQEDTFSVIDFITSRDALHDLETSVNYREIMARDNVDFLSRFPNLINGDTFEGMYDHYLNYVTVVFDATSGITELTVKAFTPEDAQAVALELLDRSEDLVNAMNKRALEDAANLARQEVEIAEKRVIANQLKMTEFRTREGMVDPEVASKQALELIAELSAEEVTIKTTLRQLEQSAAQSPQIPVLRQRLQAVTDQLSAEREKLLGVDGSVVGTYAEYEKMMLEGEFAAKALLTAQAALSSARMDAIRKQLYLERIVEPNVPDYARYPKRLLRILTFFMSFFIGYAILWLLYVNAREHKH